MAHEDSIHEPGGHALHGAGGEHGHHGGGYEERDINVRKVFITGVLFFALGFGTLLVVKPLFGVFMQVTNQSTMSTTPMDEVLPPRMGDPQTELNAAAGLQLKDVRERDHEILTTYAWVDEGRGIARVPIERAMQMLLARGLPDRSRSGAAGAATAGTATAAATADGLTGANGVPFGESNGFSLGGVP